MNFSSYLTQSLKHKHNTQLRVEIKTTSEEKALQAVDFVSWAIFRKLEYRDDSYYNLIKDKILEENPLFP